MEKPTERIRIKDIAELAGVSVGTVDRVLHGRTGVSASSKAKVEEILAQLNYQPNMYASALASNWKYRFACLIPEHRTGDYWTDILEGMQQAVRNFSDFQVALDIHFYDPYEPGAFVTSGKALLGNQPDAVVLTPTTEEETAQFTRLLENAQIPYVFVDSTLPGFTPLAFFGQNAHQSGYFAARIFALIAQGENEAVIFRQVSKTRIGSNQQKQREFGFYQFLRENQPQLRVWELNLYAKHPEDDSFLLDDFFQKHPYVRCGITFNSKAYIVGEYMQQKQRTDFRLMGYDLIKRNEACLRSGSIHFIITQQPQVQGYKSIECLCHHFILKQPVAANNFMPITLLNADNMDY